MSSSNQSDHSSEGGKSESTGNADENDKLPNTNDSQGSSGVNSAKHEQVPSSSQVDEMVDGTSKSEVKGGRQERGEPTEGRPEIRTPTNEAPDDDEPSADGRHSSGDSSPIFFSDDDDSPSEVLIGGTRITLNLDDDDDDDDEDNDSDDDDDDDDADQQESDSPADEAWLGNVSAPLSNLQSSDSNSSEETDFMKRVPIHAKEVPKPKPRHKWFIVPEVMKRELGTGNRLQASELFQKRCYGSLHVVQRLELMYKLEAHKGCVNSLNFNESGTLLASASDDRKVMLWDWTLGKSILAYESGHTSNVFQVKFLPLSGDRHLVSSSRDGQIRLAVLSGTGVCKATRQLARHRRPVHKLATLSDTPHVFHSAGEDGLVMTIDVRENRPKRFFVVRDDATGKIPLFSIHNNPMNSHEFCVAGDDKYVRLYDKRKIASRNKTPLKKFCPHHLMSRFVAKNVTCAVFNYNGTEILSSYMDEDIYLFDTKHSDGSDYVHRYRGHRNHVTVKGVNFFGLKSEFVVSGSDCGHIYFWEKNTESVVQWMAGDEEGIVNAMEPHPQVPVLATCGLDHDIKIWVPSCEQEPVLDGLKTVIRFNRKLQSDMQDSVESAWDMQIQGLLRHINRYERYRPSFMEQQDPSPTSSHERIFNHRSRVTSESAMNVDSLNNSNSSSSSSTGGDDDVVGRPQCSTS